MNVKRTLLSKMFLALLAVFTLYVSGCGGATGSGSDSGSGTSGSGNVSGRGQ